MKYAAIAIAALTMVAAVYMVRARSNTPIIFSPKNTLEAVWLRYKLSYLEQETGGSMRTLDRQRGNITTSEGQSYTMLRAVWLDDHPAFDASWSWTKSNLQFKDSHIFSWLYGRKSDGSMGIITEQNGQNSASDADTDIAMALLFAYARWRDPKYLLEARNIVQDIWDNEVVTIRGRPYLAANNVEKMFTDKVTVNPSYLAPYAYRMFADIDPAHNWKGLIDTSYEVLSQSIAMNLTSTTSAGLPPNWVAISRTDGSVYAPSQRNLDTDFGYDALRVPWRMALDWQWYAEPRAKAVLSSMSFLDSEWRKKNRLNAIYGHSGVSKMPISETPAMYGGSIGALMLSDPASAKDLYGKKLVSLYNPDSASWKNPLGYYDDNWAWFGIAMYNGLLPNLWSGVADSRR